MKKIFSLFAAVLFAGSMMAADYTLTFPKNTSGSSYTAAHETTCDGVTWDVFGNQSLDGDILRIGGKNTTNTDRTITGKNSLDIVVASVTINHDGIGNGKNSEITVNSFKLEVADNASFTDADVVTKESPDVSAAGAITFKPTSGTSWAADSYYRITMNYKVTASGTANNCYVVINNIVFAEYTTNPSISASPTTWNFGAWEQADGAYVEKTINIQGANLTDQIALNFTGALFSVVPNRITPDADGSIDADVTIKSALGWVANESYELHVSSLATTPDFDEKTILTASINVVAPVTNCATARTAALAVSGNNVPFGDGSDYTVRGYVTEIATAWSSDHKNISFWIADAKDGGQVIQAYRAACETEAEAPKVGDLVDVTGILTRYSTTPEFAQGCTFNIVTATAIDETEAAGKATKELREGQVLIIKGNKTYNILGQEIR